MADLADLAQAQIDIATSVALNRKTGYTGESAHYCCECDEPIPEKRRKLIKGCQRCVDCQQLKEHRR